ncbi:MAG: sulfate permease, partial [Gammaproteobacteria bacterium]|nr:sulfate permease [Gammaproteobacteria bacterium]
MMVPYLGWIGELKNPQTVRADLLAGITVALVLIPQSMAYAQLASLPPYIGLYASFIPVILAALMGSSRQLATGPVAVVSLMAAAALQPLAASSPDELLMYAAVMALLVGVFQLALGLFRLGVLVDFLSHPVVVGFTNGAAIIIATSQISKLFGVSAHKSEHHYETVWSVLVDASQNTHMSTLLMGLLALAIMILLKKFLPKVPGVLTAVVVTTVLGYVIGFESMGGKVVGDIPKGLPSLSTPSFNFEVVLQLASTAMTIALIGFMEAIAIAKAMATQTRQRLDTNQELVGQGLANIASGLFQGYPVSGSFSRSAVNINAGAKTGMSSVFTALFVLLTLLFLTPLLYHLPQAVLAAIIIMAVIGLVNFQAVKHAWHANRHDGIAAVVTFIATLAFAPHLDNGIMVGAGLALVLFLMRTMKPRVAQLGRYKDGTLRDISVNPGLPTSEHVVAMRFDGQLYFANVSFFEDTVLTALADHPKATYFLVVGDGIN